MQQRISNRSSRRTFMKSTLGAMGTLAFADPVTSLAAAQERRTAPIQNYQRFNLTAAEGSFDVGDGQISQGYTYNNSFPGPMIEIHKGQTLAYSFRNLLSQPTTVHWHGMVVPHIVDGHPRNLVQPGQRVNLRFPVVQRACLNWYHPHPHGMTGEQVNKGLAGGFIIRDNEELMLDLPRDEYEQTMIIRDAEFDVEGNLQYAPPPSGFFGDTPLVNGRQNATMSIGTEVYRFRLLNGANARVFRLALSDGSPFTIIGNDGGLLEFPGTATEIEFGPGERLDLLVDFRNYNLGAEIRLLDLDTNWDLVRLDVTSVDTPIYSIPGPNDRLSVIESLGSPSRMREFFFAGHDLINGMVYQAGRVDFEMPFGETELWRFSSFNGPHPIHVHGTSFQVISRIGGRKVVFPWEQGWKDTVLLRAGETIDVLVRFDTYDDQLYMLHCHQLEHEDAGMMLDFRVAAHQP